MTRRRISSPPSPLTPANQSWSQRRRPRRSRTTTFELTKAMKEAAATMATATAKPTPTSALAACEVGMDVMAWRRHWLRLIEEGSRRTWMHSSASWTASSCCLSRSRHRLFCVNELCGGRTLLLQELY